MNSLVREGRLIQTCQEAFIREGAFIRSFNLYFSFVLECFLIGDFLVGDPPPVIFFGIY